MDGKIIALFIIVAIIAAGGVYVLASQGPKTSEITDSSSQFSFDKYKHTSSIHENQAPVNNSTKTKISAQQAMDIVNKDLKAKGYTGWKAGYPKLGKNGSTLVWHVPVLNPQGKAEYEVDINANTGQYTSV